MASLTDPTTYRTWTVGELVTKAMMDQQIRDDGLWLKAIAEVAGRTAFYVADECLYIPGINNVFPYLNGGVFGATVVGAGAGYTMNTTTAANPGQVNVNAGTTATGAAGLIGQTDQIQLGTNDFRYQGIVGLSALSDGTNTYTVRCGLGDSGVAESVDFVGFRYTNGTNGGRWQGVTRANSVESTVDTAITATAAFQTLGFTVNAAGNSVQFYVAGVAAGAPITTNIPTGTARLLTFLPGMILKSLGTTSRALIVDAYSYLMALAR